MTDGTGQDAADTEQHPTAVTPEDLARNLAAVRERIAAAARRAGRSPGDVRLLPVSKTVPEDRIRAAAAAGCTQFGENKVQEALRKWQDLSDLDLSWSVIGHLQRNKIKDVVRCADEFHALDSDRLAEGLERRLQADGRDLDVFVQVNTSQEESKYGLPPEETLAFLRRLRAFDTLRVRGLMTLAVFSADADRVRQCFRMLRHLRDRARDEDPELIGDGGLSMGMSGDYEIAIEEGATVVRIGQSVFGARPTPDSHYWPAAQNGRKDPS